MPRYERNEDGQLRITRADGPGAGWAAGTRMGSEGAQADTRAPIHRCARHGAEPTPRGGPWGCRSAVRRHKPQDHGRPEATSTDAVPWGASGDGNRVPPWLPSSQATRHPCRQAAG